MKILVLFLTLSISRTFAARSIFLSMIEEQYRINPLRSPSSEKTDEVPFEQLTKLFDKGYSIYRSKTGDLIAAKKNKKYTIFNSRICSEQNVDISKLIGEGYQLTNVNSDIYIKKDSRVALLHPSMKMICYKY